jgi:hypothetical protein
MNHDALFSRHHERLGFVGSLPRFRSGESLAADRSQHHPNVTNDDLERAVLRQRVALLLDACERDPPLLERVRALLAPEGAPALLDRQGLARELQVSPATVDRLRADGCPELIVGASPRFELAAVLAWIRARSERAA